MVPKGERAMRGPSPKPVVVIPSGHETTTPTRTSDQYLSVLNPLGATLIVPSTPRPWDGQTISLTSFRTA
jgi:hypothetical protein